MQGVLLLFKYKYVILFKYTYEYANVHKCTVEFTFSIVHSLQIKKEKQKIKGGL